MPVQIREFTEDWQESVRDFNRRLANSQLWRPFQFPESPWAELLCGAAGGPREERVLATEDRAVRGAYILRRQDFAFFSELQSIAHYRLPLSEGVVNRSYAGVGFQLVRDALARQPLLFALGMGGLEKPLPRMLKALGWILVVVPFFFKVNRPARFLRNISALRTSPLRRLALDVAAFSGGGALAISASQALRTARVPDGAAVEVAPVFAGWTDAIWDEAKNHYAMAGVRDQKFLNGWYPPADDRLIRLRISRGGRELGWALVLDTRMRDDRHFGNLRLGSIADAFAAPGNAHTVVGLAAKFLEQRGVDLVVANHSHVAWRSAFRRAGFLDGPSNFIFGASPKLAERVGPPGTNMDLIYINRGDGDGPIHL